MSEQSDLERLLDLIDDRRQAVDAYLRTARPRATRLTYVVIVSSALAAALTAGPGIGGQKFTGSVTKLPLLDSDADVWRTLCLLAMALSVVAAVSADLSKARNAEARIVAAEACIAELAGLRTLIEFQQVSLPEALKLYLQYVARVPFIRPPTAGAGLTREPAADG